jgi:hypothetical protein
MKRVIVGILMLGFLLPSAWAGAPDMKDGEWEMTIETEIAGMPMKLPPVTTRQCMTRDNPVPEGQQDQECKVTDMKTSGNTVSWVVKCDTPGGGATGTGNVTYAKDKMNGVMTMETQGMKMTYNMKGQHVGPCKK